MQASNQSAAAQTRGIISCPFVWNHYAELSWHCNVSELTGVVVCARYCLLGFAGVCHRVCGVTGRQLADARKLYYIGRLPVRQWVNACWIVCLVTLGTVRLTGSCFTSYEALCVDV